MCHSGERNYWVVVILNRGKDLFFVAVEILRCAQPVCRLGAATQERNPTTAPQTHRPKLVGLRCRSTRPTATFCRVALPLHRTYGHVLSGCAAAPPDLRLRSVGLGCFSTRPATSSTNPPAKACRVALPLHPTYGHVLSGCAAAPPNLRPRSVGLRCRSTQPTTTFCRVALPLHPTYDLPAAPPDLRPSCRSTRPTTTFCWVALPLHRTYDYALSGCAAAPPNLRLDSVRIIDNIGKCYSTIQLVLNQRRKNGGMEVY